MPKLVLPTALIEGETALRPWRDSDLGQLVALCQDAEISRWTRVPTPYTENDARLYLLHRYDQTHAGERAPFAITTPDRETVLGSTSLMHVDWNHRNAEVGYWLGAPARGHGHATAHLRGRPPPRRRAVRHDRLLADRHRLTPDPVTWRASCSSCESGSPASRAR